MAKQARIYFTSDSYSSQSMEILLIELTLWAKKQLLTSLESYEEYWFVSIIFYLET